MSDMIASLLTIIITKMHIAAIHCWTIKQIQISAREYSC